MVGKEKEARAWVEVWKQKIVKEREKVQDAIGKDATAMVIEMFGKESESF